MKKSFYTVITLYKINTRRFFRDRLALFFGIGFPLIFLFVFGGLFSGNNDVSFNVALVNQSHTKFADNFSKELKDSKVIKVKPDITNLSEAKQKMSRSEIDATIVLPSDFGAVDSKTHMPGGQAKVLYTQNNEQSGSALKSVLAAMFKGINGKFVTEKEPFSVQSDELKEKSLTQFDYTFAGLLGFAILGMGIFGPINVFPELKKMGILRRLSTTPLRVWEYFLSVMLGQATTGLISIVIMFAVAIGVFHLNVVGNVLELAIYTVLSIFMILGIGLAIGGWAKNERQAAPLSNIIVFPMMFLAGTFFPRFLMPEWLQTVSGFLPLTPVIDGIRLISTEGMHLTQILPQLGLVLGWMVIVYFIAFRVFRWE